MTRNSKAGIFSARSLALTLLILLLAGTFTELGIWQLHRAQEVSRLNKPQPEKPVVALTSIAKPGSNLSPTAINRLVTFSGHYVKQYVADYQRAIIPSSPSGSSVQTVTLNVGLFQIDLSAKSEFSPAAILVARGVGVGSENLPTGKVTIVGRLNPRQTDDLSNSDASHLSRIDPGLVAGTAGLQLFDGYVVARRENSETGAEITFPRIASPMAKGKTAGFYWQHLSYVFIWWSLAILILIAPILSAKEKREKDKVRS